MDPQNDPQDIVPHRPQPGRPVFSDVAAARPAAPRPLHKPGAVLDLRQTVPRPASPAAGTPQLVSNPTPPRPALQVAPTTRPAAPQTPTPAPSEPARAEPEETPSGNAAPPPRRSRTGYAWAVGWVLFVVLGGLMLLVLSGKVLTNFPGSSYSESSGDQTIACAATPTSPHTATTYDHKNGFPFVYRYATTSTLTARCGSSTQTATSGHASQFNPLAGVIDIAIAAVIAIAAARVWRLVFGSRR